MTDSYVPTLNADGDIQNVATQQSERGGKTIETQEFAIQSSQLTTLTPPANPDPSTETKQDDLITAIGTLQSTIEALTTAVGLLAKLTDTQPVNTNWSKVSTLNSASGVHVGGMAGDVELLECDWEDASDYGEAQISINVPDASSISFGIQYSDDGVNALSSLDDGTSFSSAESLVYNIRAKYYKIILYPTIVDEGSGEHTYTVETILRKRSAKAVPYGLNLGTSTLQIFQMDADYGGLVVSLSQTSLDLLQTIANNTGA